MVKALPDIIKKKCAPLHSCTDELVLEAKGRGDDLVMLTVQICITTSAQSVWICLSLSFCTFSKKQKRKTSSLCICASQGNVLRPLHMRNILSVCQQLNYSSLEKQFLKYLLLSYIVLPIQVAGNFFLIAFDLLRNHADRLMIM